MTDPAPAVLPGEEPEEPGPLLCSAKGCSAPARWQLLWNNPKLHTPERRKVWLACEQHRETLGAFLGARSFLRDVVPVDDDAHDDA